MLYLVLSIAGLLLLSGYLRPWMELRSKGIHISAKNYFSPVIKKDIFSSQQNRKIFRALETINSSQLDITFDEIKAMVYANVDFQNFVDSYQLSKERDVQVSKDELRILAYAFKDVKSVVNSKKPGERIIVSEVLGV